MECDPEIPSSELDCVNWRNCLTSGAAGVTSNSEYQSSLRPHSSEGISSRNQEILEVTTCPHPINVTSSVIPANVVDPGGMEDSGPTLNRSMKNKRKPYDCILCGKTLSCYSNLERHIMYHTGYRPYKCPMAGCEKDFTGSSDLARHVRVNHNTNKRFECPWEGCESAFPSSFSLAVHRSRVHSAGKSSKSRRSGDSKTSSKHTRRRVLHSNVKRTKCPWEGCGKSFEKRYYLKVHMRIHTGEKPFKCSWAHCGKAFNQSGALVTHTRIHTGEKPFKCTRKNCGMAFRHTASFINHKRRHTVEESSNRRKNLARSSSTLAGHASKSQAK